MIYCRSCGETHEAPACGERIPTPSIYTGPRCVHNRPLTLTCGECINAKFAFRAQLDLFRREKTGAMDE